MKNKYIMMLKTRKECFDANEEDFSILEKMSFEELSSDSIESSKVTGLLNEIVNYALIDVMFNDFEQSTIEFFCKDTDSFYQAKDVVNASFCYVVAAIGNRCHHPSLEIFYDLVEGNNTYENLMSSICDIIEKDNYDIIRDYVFDEYDSIDTYIIDEKERAFKNVVNSLGNIKDYKELLNVWSSLAITRATNKMMLSNYSIYDINDMIVCLDDVNKCSDILVLLIEKIINSKYYNENIENNIKSMEKEYQIYKRLQYDFLKNKNDVEKTVKKHKKM